MGPRKRTAEAFEPFKDVNHGSRSQSGSSQGGPVKKARIANSMAGSSRDTPMLIDDDDDDDDDEGLEENPVDPHEHEYHFVLYGTMPTKIVGLRYYQGYADVGEKLIVQREPHNQYDKNAIRALNLGGDQIGHIPRTVAQKLAPYMDDRSLVIEGHIVGEHNSFDCPIQLQLYGTNDPVARDRLMEKMKAAKLPVADVRDRVRRAERERKEALKAASKRRPSSEFVGSSSHGIGPGPTLSDIIGSSQIINPRSIEQVVEEFGVKEKDLAAMRKAPQPQALSTELHPFQLQGLRWMLEKEFPQLPVHGSRDVVQLWQRHPTRPNDFTHVATNYSLRDPPLASGGILADDMGLGKTIQVIALIMADRERGPPVAGVSNATLILAPVSVMSNWSTQMEKHIQKEHALRVMFYHGSRKQKIDPQEIGQYDVVISTYDSVSTEWHAQKETKLPRKSGVFSVKWRRVILDEGHNIRNPNAKKTIAAWNLMAQSRWVLTGTPIINNLKDLYSLVRFIGLSGGMDRLDIFHGALIRPVTLGHAQGNKVLQLLMGDICLRRKKEMSFIDLRLPALEEYVHKITLYPHEQEKYDALRAQAKGTLDVYRRDLQGSQGAKDAGATYRHLLEVLLRMRQLCNHWSLVGEERLETIMTQLEADGVVDLTPENKAALQQMLQLSIESQEECPICLEPLRDPVITKCTHIFCTSCIERVIETQHKCPMCRAELESLQSTTVKPSKELSDPLPTPPSSSSLFSSSLFSSSSDPKDPSTPSSKISALLTILSASKSQDHTTKTIIFSQWTTFLTLLTPHLLASGYKLARIDGSMSAPARDAALHALDTDPDTTILLASLAVSSVGLNLVAANHVIMADSWWAPAIEDQAVDRVHRLGQKRETKVWRLVVEGSIEERVLGIQEDKRKLMGLAFAEKDGGRGKKRTGAGLADLERLLGSQTQRPRE
ncbi:SNF2 family N-terminal domain-containing protein [Dendryphion nanum]|uniref:SNF2 family N-terminal domain-containing protein n=1 Tax=Dendryphion nanum TaxID=256645 RepID=A0A9P9E813_9PLEO|nr:SNF2 family N-terminal domain-containing protein [Dendryphion nanum]